MVFDVFAFACYIISGSGCIDAGQADVWLNLPQVRKALHVLDLTRLPKWVICTDLNYDSNIPALYPEPYLSLIQVFYEFLHFLLVCIMFMIVLLLQIRIIVF
jgi:hypothetical protein